MLKLQMIFCRNPSFVANKQNIRYLVEHSPLTVLTKTKTNEIKENSVVVELEDGSSKEIEANTVIFSTGFRADHTLYEELKKSGVDVVEIGDALKPGKVIQAIHQGYHTIRVYE